MRAAVALGGEQGFAPLLTFNVSPRQLRRADLVASILERIDALRASSPTGSAPS